MTDDLYEIKTYDDSELTNKQNEIINSCYNSTAKILGLQSPTGSGKTRMFLKLAIKRRNVVIFTPTLDITKRYFDEMKKIINDITSSGVTIGFVFGKGCSSPLMCPAYQKYKKNNPDAKILPHQYCKDHKKECWYNKNMTEDTINSTYTPTTKVNDTINDWNRKINSDYCLKLDITLDKISRAIRDNDWCPYYFFRNMASRCDIKICDLQYFIIASFVEGINIDFGGYYAIIDEFDIARERIKGMLESALSHQKLIMRQKKLDINDDFDQLLYDLVSFFIYWLTEKGKFTRHINMEDEMNVDSNLMACIQIYNTLKNNHKEKFNELMLEDKTNEITKLLRFIETRKYNFGDDVASFVEYIEKTDDLRLIRIVISLKIFYNTKKRFYKTITIGSATLPDKRLMKLNFGHEIDIVSMHWNVGRREGVIYKSNLFNLTNNCLKKGEYTKKERVKPLIEIVNKSDEKAFVVFSKSRSLIKKGRQDNLELLHLNEINKECRKNKIKSFIIDSIELKKQAKEWEKFFSYAISKKSVAFTSAQGRNARGVDFLKGDNCRVIIMWGIPYAQQPNKFILPKIKEAYAKVGVEYDLVYNCLEPRIKYQQAIGRLVRSNKDYGFFVLCAHKDLGKILPSNIREDLGIVRMIDNVDSVSYIMKSFFDDERSNTDD